MSHDDTLAIEEALGRVLAWGSRASTVVLALGLLLGVLAPSRYGVLMLHTGLMLLMATPVLRVLVSVVAFGGRREWTFAALTSIVLVLLVSVILAMFA